MNQFLDSFQILGTVQGWTYLLILTLLEIVLGIDNIIFISIAVNKLPLAQQKKARTFGLSLALIVRTILLIFVGWIAGLKDALFMIGPYGISGKSIILICREQIIKFLETESLALKCIVLTNDCDQ